MSHSTTESLDLFPTLAEAAGIGVLSKCPKESIKYSTCTEGMSLMPLIAEPTKLLKTGALSQIGSEYTLRTERFRFIQKCLRTENMSSCKWDNKDIKLFDHDMKS